ncbi:hypothetical protein ASG52_25700 [Methylobacterium sp. Leaf456]|uniref:hypothetical protein n=1 Tax=Methylobacterium sp. Leaf456 TaxID=1736382 RepID=UPI0006FAE5F8|nr:hypothetical protein [Methylobacterium sp. Leaf456]KQT51292.1 hypothetical protein ASG52_25700 [Methylobacterium sp. Leaf456]
MATVLALSAARPDGRAALRHRVERAADLALDVAARLIAYLDALDGNPDAEGDGTAEPAHAALVADGAQLPWAGFDDPRTDA